MNIPDNTKLRLQFLARVVKKESYYLNRTTERLFTIPFSLERARQIEHDDDLSEQVEAFTSRFARLQDTLGDKLIPKLLTALGERNTTVMDNLDTAERLNWIPSADEWLAIRQLRNQMVHDYIEDLEILISAIQSARTYVSTLSLVAENLQDELKKRELL